MKDEEFQKKLELILEKFYEVDREAKKYFDREKFNGKKEDRDNRSYCNDTSILDSQYKVKR